MIVRYYNDLSGLRQDHINKLQLVQNYAVRLLTGTRKHGHISPILGLFFGCLFRKELILNFYFLHLNDLMIQHRLFEELLVRYRPTKTQRSAADKGLLVQTIKYNLKTYDYRAFSHAAPKIWNSMPVNIRTCCELDSFKSKIKTFLFKRAFQL